jgi:hypothetical protein
MSGRPLQSLWLRRATVTLLRANADLVALGDPPIADRIYGRRQPDILTWPFVRVSVADEGPLRKGTDVRLTAHSFSKAQFDDECELIDNALQEALENAVIELSPAVTAYVTWDGSQVIPDAAEADAWHGVNRFTATIA